MPEYNRLQIILDGGGIITAREKAKYRSQSTWKDFRRQQINLKGHQCECCGTIHKSGLNLHHHDDHHYKDLNPAKFSVLCKTCHKHIEWILSHTANPIDLSRYFKNIEHIVEESV